MKRRISIAAAAAAAFLLLAPTAAGHVTINPDRAEADSFARFAIRVPNERPRADTTEVTLRLPEGLFFVSFQPKPGWKRSVKIEKLAQPVTIFGQKISERVAQVSWSGGRIRPGEFDEFGMSARLADAAGTELVFPSLQTYSSGEIVRWIGPPDADEPAPRVALTPPEQDARPAGQTAAGGTEDTESADEGDQTRANIALGLGAAGLAAGLSALGLALVRRPRR